VTAWRFLAAPASDRRPWIAGDVLAQNIDFHEIFRISPTGMAVLCADLFFVDVNDQFLAEAGRPLEELIGHNFFMIFPKMPAVLGDTGGWRSRSRPTPDVRNLTPVIAQYEGRWARRKSPAAEEALAEQPDTPGQRERAAPQ
jgi:PAS domain-containing protein